MRCRDRGRPARVPAVVALLAVVLGTLTACATDPKLSTAVREVRMTSAAGEAELVLLPPGEPSKVVVFMHGFDSDQDQLLTTSALFPVRDALLAAGFAIATSDSHGNNVGNPVSLADQLDLIADVGKVVPTVGRLDILAFSMGGLDALLAANQAPTAVNAVVLVSPVTDQSAFLDTRFEKSIASAFSGSGSGGLLGATAASNPSRKPAAGYRGPRYQFWHSTDDTVVPVAQSTSMVKAMDAAGVDATFSALDGDHGNMSRLDPRTVIDFLEKQ